MFFAHGTTLTGIYHQKNNIVCQDAHKYLKCSGRVFIAAVADGLGSEEHSDAAATIAVNQSVACCAENIHEHTDADDILDAIREAFAASLCDIEKMAEQEEYPLDQCDTTLTLAVLIDEKLYFGHAGDSGLIALTTDGRYEAVTAQQRDEYGNVYPLCFRDKWVIETSPLQIAGVLLATDGVLELLFPYLLREEKNPLYISLAHYLMNPTGAVDSAEGEEQAQQRMREILESIPEEQVADDKTVLIALNTVAQMSAQPDTYYEAPDWDNLKKKFDAAWRRSAYPHLYEAEGREDD